MGFEFDKDLLNQAYKNIWLDCMNEGVPIPYLIKQNTNRLFYPTMEDREELGKKLSDKQKDKLSEAYYNRRLKESELWSSTSSYNKRLQLIGGYMEEELIEFFKQFPIYKKLLK